METASAIASRPDAEVVLVVGVQFEEWLTRLDVLALAHQAEYARGRADLSSLRARPAPSRQAATPTRQRVDPLHVAAAGRDDDLSDRGDGSWRRRDRRPGRRSSLDNLVYADPSSSFVAGSMSRPTNSNISRARARVRSRTSLGPPPRRTSTDSATSRALPTARPSGVLMGVSRATVLTP